MKSIEERAREAWNDYEYGVGELYSSLFCDGYEQGAHEEHKLLTEWHDPKEPPTHENEVLVKYICGTGGCEFCIVAYYKVGEWRAPNSMFDEYDTIIGWREIHE